MSKLNIARNCDSCGNEDSIDTTTGLCPSCNNEISPARETAIEIIEQFEDMLDSYNITLPSKDREGGEEEARIYGTEYYILEDAITEIIERDGGFRK